MMVVGECGGGGGGGGHTVVNANLAMFEPTLS